MKILYTPYMTIPSLNAADVRLILDSLPGATLSEAAVPQQQKTEIRDADVLFGRVSPDVFACQRQLLYYHFIGAGVDSILTEELIHSKVVLVSDKGQVGVHLAEHAFALLLALTRGVHIALRQPDYGLREPIA